MIFVSCGSANVASFFLPERSTLLRPSVFERSSFSMLSQPSRLTTVTLLAELSSTVLRSPQPERSRLTSLSSLDSTVTILGNVLPRPCVEATPSSSTDATALASSCEIRPSPLVSYLVETSARMPLSGKVFSSIGVVAIWVKQNSAPPPIPAATTSTAARAMRGFLERLRGVGCCTGTYC